MAWKRSGVQIPVGPQTKNNHGRLRRPWLFFLLPRRLILDKLDIGVKMSKLENDSQEICGQVNPEEVKPVKEGAAGVWIIFGVITGLLLLRVLIYGVSSLREGIFWFLLEALILFVTIRINK